ncbi:MAG: glycosyltransferase [Aquihabitans sp.]
MRALDRLRLAYVTAAFPYPLRSGYLRHHHLIRHLAQRFDVNLYALAPQGVSESDRSAMEPFTSEISTFHHQEGRRARLRRLIDPNHPTPSAHELAISVDRAITEGQIDAVLLSGKETATVVDHIHARVPLIIDLCDATSARVAQEMAVSGLLRRRALASRRTGLRVIERRLIAAGDALTVISSRDRELLESEGAPATVRASTVIPNGIDVDQWRRTDATLGFDVVFCGNLGYRPNADAALHLVRDVMPLVWNRFPATAVTIIGTGASTDLCRRLTHPSVALTGTVDDVRPHLERAAVFVAPLRMAVGVQNKILEALSLGIPVVASKLAADGLVTNGEDPPLTRADGPEETATAIVHQLLRRSQGEDQADEATRAWVAERFQWDRSAEHLGDLIEAAYRREDISC